MTSPHTESRPNWQARLVAALVALAASWFVAVQDPVPAWEVRLTRWINDAPGAVAWLLWPVMQLGSLVGPVLVAVVLVVVRRPKRAVMVLVSGVGAWYLAKFVKSIVERGRPLAYVPGVEVREGEGTGLGYVSGHSAVAFAVAFALSPILPRWGRWLAIGAAAAVGLARIVYGVHLPADVVGGAALGVLVATAVEAIALVLGRRRAEASSAPASTV
jgi:undecaprenyl-diphosphatase